MNTKILVPLDGTPLSEEALAYAREIAKKDGAEIFILRVPEHIKPKYPVHAYVESMRAQEEAEKAAKAYVDEKISMLKKENIQAQGMTRSGPVIETILSTAEEIKADMIAMSTHGRKGLEHLLKGSVAEKIVQNAHIPVTVIHLN